MMGLRGAQVGTPKIWHAGEPKGGGEGKTFPVSSSPSSPSPLHSFLSFLALNMLGSQDERCRHWFFFHAACLQLLNRRACCIETNGIRRIAALAHMFSRHAKRGRGDFPLPALLSLNPISSLWQLLMCTLGSTRRKGKKWEENCRTSKSEAPSYFFGSDRSANKKVLPLSPEQTNEGLLARTVPQRWKEGFHSKRRLATANCKSASQKMSSIEFFWRKRQENTFPPPKKCKVSPLRKKSRKRSQFPSRKQKKILPNFRRDDNR